MFQLLIALNTKDMAKSAVLSDFEVLPFEKYHPKHDMLIVYLVHIGSSNILIYHIESPCSTEHFLTTKSLSHCHFHKNEETLIRLMKVIKTQGV